MWLKIGDWIIRFRATLMTAVLALSVFLGYYGLTHVEMTQEFIKVIPVEDPDYQNYISFKRVFGEDGNALIVAMESDDWFTVSRLNALRRLSDELRALPGVLQVLNISELSVLTADTLNERLYLRKVMPRPLAADAQADSIKNVLLSQPFYRSLILDATGKFSVMAVTLSDTALRTKQKHKTVALINEKVEAFAAAHKVVPHSSGLPFFRAYITKQIPKELALFTGLSLLLTACALLYFYRSWYAVVFPMVLLVVCSLWTLGITSLLGYKLTVLTGLLPPIIIILGVPPCVYMLSDYYEEYKKVGNKYDAIRQMLRKLGLVTMMINANTAFGFLTLYFTDVTVLQEFGMVAFLGTTAAYFLTIILIPGVFSLLPPPSEERLKRLETPRIRQWVAQTNQAISFRRNYIYGFTILTLVIAGVGVSRLKAVSFMSDDLPTHDVVYTDLKFLEQKFKGIMPFEVVLKAPKKGSFKSVSFLKKNLKKIDALQQKLESYPEISRMVSVADGMKWSRQALLGDSSAYKLPTEDELDFILLYAQNNKSETKAGKDKTILNSVIDSTYTYTRITGFVKDVGSVEMPLLMNHVQADIDSLFPPSKDPNVKKIETYATGMTRIFLKANEYLIENLKWSLLAVFLLIGLQMWALFGSWRIMLISMIPNIIPLVVTAGLMGFLAIPLKPSTALIYELAFGIAIDNSIHYLAAYRHERRERKSILRAVQDAMDTTGVGIIYTSIVLLAGFGVFAGSAFGSTRALGLLTSVTLLVALFSNLLLMPALLLSFDKENESLKAALIDDED